MSDPTFDPCGDPGGDPSTAVLRIGATVTRTRVEGPHLRFAVWVAGCSIRCPGCCNPEWLDPTVGTTRRVGALLEAIDPAIDPAIEGITILGGEPLEQLVGVTALAIGARRRGLGVVVSTGLTERQAWARPGFASLWRALDTLIAGPFVARRREPVGGRRLIGSSNQRLLHRTERYTDPAAWLGPRGAEARLDAAGRVTLVGDPKLVAKVRRRLPA